MLNWLMLAQTTRPGEGAMPQSLDEQVADLWQKLVGQMPVGGLKLIMLMVAVTLVIAAYIAWNQWTLASNQIKMAKLLEEHLKSHKQ